MKCLVKFFLILVSFFFFIGCIPLVTKVSFISEKSNMCVCLCLLITLINCSTGGQQINDRYEFPLQLDLDRENGKYLSPDADRSVRNLYTLHRY